MVRRGLLVCWWCYPIQVLKIIKPEFNPLKLKFLLGRHFTTNSFGLGRLFYKSSRQLQNVRHHGGQNGCNLKGWSFDFKQLLACVQTPPAFPSKTVRERREGGICTQAKQI